MQGIEESVLYYLQMFIINGNKSEQLLTMSFSAQVDPKQTQHCVNEVKAPLEHMKPGFHFLTDLSDLDHMDAACAGDIGKIMDLCTANGVGAVSSVVPNPGKDIGFALMYSFHYGRSVCTMTHETLEDALKTLAE